MLRIALTGIDGSGKSTTALHVARAIQENGLRVKTIWFRWRAFFSYAAYAYGRTAGFTLLRPNTRIRGAVVSFNEFYRSPVLRRLYPWTQLFDMLIFYLFLRLRLYLTRTPLVMYDRFLVDTVVDVAHKTKRPELLNSIFGQILLALSQRLDVIFFLDVDPLVAYSRDKGGDISSETELIQKRALYKKAIERLRNARTVDASQTVSLVARDVLDYLHKLPLVQIAGTIRE